MKIECLENLLELALKIALHQIKQTLDYIQSNLWGPSRITSHGGAIYFLSIIDNYSINFWIYILKNKSDTFTKFKE